MTTTFKQMSTFAFLVDAIRRSVRDNHGHRPLTLSLGPAVLFSLRASPEMRCMPWPQGPYEGPMLYGVPIVELRHREPPRITHASGQEEEL